MKKMHYLLIICLCGLMACDDARVFEKTEAIKSDEGWDAKDRIPFEVDIQDTTSQYNLLLDLRISDNYPYSNLYILLHTTDPVGQHTREMKHFALADDKGKWLGEGLGDIHSYRLPMSQKVQFRKAGKYKFEIEQNMRIEVLPAVKDVGLRLEKAN